MTEDSQNIENKAVVAAWERATKIFANAKTMRPRMSWLTGVGMDTTANRLQRLLSQPRTAALHAALSELDELALRRFLHRTEINLERAAAAMRLSLVVNLSVPVGALVIVYQLFPQAVTNFVADYDMDAIIIASTTVLFLLLLSIWHSYCSVTQARDLAHLTRLYAARPFDAASASYQYDDEPLNPAELA